MLTSALVSNHHDIKYGDENTEELLRFNDNPVIYHKYMTT